MKNLFIIFNLLRTKKIQLNVNQLTILCYIAKNGSKNITTEDIKNELNYSQHSSVQRICDTLAKGFYYNDTKKIKRFRKGLEFIKKEVSLQDSRYKNLLLTKDGNNFLSSINNIIKRNVADAR
jgi:DNA-binding MarR family transcriptional regulator